MVIGRQGYIDSCREIVGCRREIEYAVREQIPEIKVMGKPMVSVVAFQSDIVNILEVGDRMSKLGWHCKLSLINVWSRRLTSAPSERTAEPSTLLQDERLIQSHVLAGRLTYMLHKAHCFEGRPICQ